MTRYMFDYDRSYSPPAAVLDIVVDGYDDRFEPEACRAIVDSGADATMFPEKMLKRINAQRLAPDGLQFVRGVTGAREAVSLYVVRIRIGEIEVGGIRAAAIGNECIIGRDLLNRLIVELNGLSLDVTVSDGA